MFVYIQDIDIMFPKNSEFLSHEKKKKTPSCNPSQITTELSRMLTSLAIRKFPGERASLLLMLQKSDIHTVPHLLNIYYV